MTTQVLASFHLSLANELGFFFEWPSMLIIPLRNVNSAIKLAIATHDPPPTKFLA
jgi:hypothetical protein